MFSVFKKQMILFLYPQAPELGLDVGFGLKGDLNWRASALAGDALGFHPGVQVASGFEGYGRCLRGADLEGE